MPSLMWAGGHRKHERHGVMVEVRFDAFAYRIEIGLVTGIQTIFMLDPEVKEESVTFAEGRRKPVKLMERAGPTAWMRDDDGKRVTYPRELSSSESVLSQLRDRHRYPEVASIAERIQGVALLPPLPHASADDAGEAAAGGGAHARCCRRDGEGFGGGAANRSRRLETRGRWSEAD